MFLPTLHLAFCHHFLVVMFRPCASPYTPTFIVLNDSLLNTLYYCLLFFYFHWGQSRLKYPKRLFLLEFQPMKVCQTTLAQTLTMMPSSSTCNASPTALAMSTTRPPKVEFSPSFHNSTFQMCYPLQRRIPLVAKTPLLL
jgi:hypothetical protein